MKKIRRKIVLFILGMFLPNFLVFPQIKVFIEPEYNFFKPLGRIDKKIVENSLRQPRILNLVIDLGVSASVRLSNHTIKFGYRLVTAGLNWRITTPTEYVKKAGGSPYTSSYRSGVGVFSDQLHISHSYIFKTKSFLPLFNLDRDDPKQKFLFRYSWFSLVGTSLEWYSPTYFEDSELSFANVPGINIQPRIEYKFLRHNNVSVFLGGGIQFFHKNKERFKISLVYSQGLFRFYEFPITVTFDGKTQYSGLMSTRGSFIGLFVSYPFLIWSKKNKPAP